MRAKFALMVAAMALGIAALAPAANADTVHLLNSNEEPLGNGAGIVAFTTDFTGVYAGDYKIHCSELEWFAEVMEAEDGSIELKQTESENHQSEFRDCWFEGPGGPPYHMIWTQPEMNLRLASDGTGELGFGVFYANAFSNEVGCLLGGHGFVLGAVSFTPSNPAKLNVEGWLDSFETCLAPMYVQFSLELEDEKGPLAIDIS